MRLVFAGTPHFAARALTALLSAGHEIFLVLTQPDRRAGRGMHAAMSPVKQLALKNALTIAQPQNLRDPILLEQLRAAAPEAMVVVAYGLLLPPTVLAIPTLGALNIHASLLPRWRGAAPIQRAILAGDARTGITIMQIEAGLDTGPMFAQESMPIAPDDSALTLHDKLACLGASMIVHALNDLQAGALAAQPQPAEGITYAHKIEKREAFIDWHLSSIELDRTVRAFNPAPGAHTVLEGDSLKIWRARPVDGHGEPGLVLSCSDNGIAVACGEGVLLLTELQRAGGKRLSARDFLLGHPLAPGVRFAPPA